MARRFIGRVSFTSILFTRFSHGLLFLLCVAAALFCDQSSYAQPTRADYERSANLDRDTFGKLFHDRVIPHWSADEESFWFRSRGSAGTSQYWVVNAITGERRLAFDHRKLASALGKAMDIAPQPDRMVIDAMTLRDGAIVLDMKGRRWEVNTESYAVKELKSATSGPESLPRLARRPPFAPAGDTTTITFVNLTSAPIRVSWINYDGNPEEMGSVPAHDRHEQPTKSGLVFVVYDQNGRSLGEFAAISGGGNVVISEEPPIASTQSSSTTDPTRSPDGKWIAFIKESNVFLRDAGAGGELQLTRDGRSSDGYDASFAWSPDSKKLVVTRTTDCETRTLYSVQSAPPDQFEPKLHAIEYARAGDPMPVSKPHLFDVVSRREIPLDDVQFANPYGLKSMFWDADSGRFRFIYRERGCQPIRLLSVDAITGKVSVTVDEHSDTFVDHYKFFSEFLMGSNEVLWASERDGWNHLYLFDLMTGKLKNQITRGPWLVRGVDRVDTNQQRIWFYASGFVPGQDPYYLHYCRINMDGTGLLDMTPADATHSVQFCPTERYYLDTYSRVDLPPVTELRNAEDGKLICTVETADVSDLSRTAWRMPERFSAKGRDGTTDIYGIIYRPSTFDSTRTYPVIDDIYSGPDFASVPKEFTHYQYAMEVAELGFIVVQIDGMGTNYRSRAFHDLCWHNLSDGGIPDHIAWLKAAAAKYKQMDLARVGIYGGSTGARNVVSAMELHNEFFKVGSAYCGCYDDRLGNRTWTEQWMGWPIGPWYAEQSCLTRADRITGHLQILAAELDDVVDPASSMKLADAIVKANKPFDYFCLPNGSHCQKDLYVDRKREDFFVEHLLGRVGNR